MESRTHEDYSRQLSRKNSSNREFGLVFTALFLVIALLPLRSGRHPRIWAFIASGVFLVATLVAPAILAPLNRAWMMLAIALSKVTTPIVLAVLFFALFAPCALLLRLLGKNPLRHETGSGNSYWIARRPPGPSPASMSNQF
jgi:hypothetical protein